ncbi:MAG: bifunctional 5,10-methylenetetrahydrofolate dehydrogenase/5,10-methenyltetrahydrofolate cyclohydrolase [Candidatus Sungbacteria bacterium]|nr:bifunctional 5,10-methylenetetrahydrofolate dehydrogenase/5,10-methenyltetrahydrofolate cyclohydrolase [Candidatus Sungbacteria bacterium]
MELVGLRKGSDVRRYTENVDIIVSGAGQAGLITKKMVKMGAVIFDFGFSKKSGVICGDVDPAVADKARLPTPVPGGMGPLAVTMLFWKVARIAGVKLVRYF